MSPCRTPIDHGPRGHAARVHAIRVLLPAGPGMRGQGITPRTVRIVWILYAGWHAAISVRNGLQWRQRYVRHTVAPEPSSPVLYRNDRTHAKKKVYRDLLITPLGYAAAETYLWQCLCATKALDALMHGLPIEGDLTNGVYSSIRSWLFFAILLRFHPFLSSLSRPSQHCCILLNGYFS